MENEKVKYIIKPNPDIALFKEISDAVKDCDGYCCCETVWNDDTKCMCKAFREQEQGGFCHCGRFYKVKDYPIITILCHPDSNESANEIAEAFTRQGFIVLAPMYDTSIAYSRCKDTYDDVQRTKIHLADLVFVMNNSEAAMEFLADEIYWAEELQKKIAYQYTEEVKENEV